MNEIYFDLRKRNAVVLANKFLIIKASKDKDENLSTIKYVVNEDLKSLKNNKNKQLTPEEAEILLTQLYSDANLCETLAENNKDSKLKRFFSKLKDVLLSGIKKGLAFTGTILGSAFVQAVMMILVSVITFLSKSYFIDDETPKDVWRKIKERKEAKKAGKVAEKTWNNTYEHEQDTVQEKTIGRKPRPNMV